MLNKNFFNILPFCPRALKGIKGSGFGLIETLKSSLLKSIKGKFVQSQIEKLPNGSEGSATIKRHAANRFTSEGKCDHTGEFTIFGQLFQQCKVGTSYQKTSFLQNGTDNKIFQTKFAGEGAIDVGGPFRECLSNLVDELESEFLPLLIKSTNNRNNHGYNRDCYILNPSSISPTHGELFVFFGYFLGFSIRTQSAMNWHFPAIFWKQMLGE